jgi:uncharacterized OB-fold protein
MSSEAIATDGQDEKPVPVPTADSVPFWEGTARGELRLQRCEACHAHQFPPRLICAHCGSREVAWVTTSGRGTIYSYTVVHRAPTPAFAADVPYVVALVDLDEGPRLMTNVVELEPAEVSVGLRVQARYAARGDRQLVLFAPLSDD